MKNKAQKVRIYPVPGVSIPPGDFSPPIHATEQEVDAATWERLQRYVPPAFTADPPIESADPIESAGSDDTQEA